MPQAGRRWWHLTLHTRGSWLHGDPRGFRSRNHRIHSSGDYKNPPPQGEHAKLHRYHRDHSEGLVLIPRQLLPIVGSVVREKCRKQGTPVLAISVGPTHVHLLVQWCDEVEAAKKLAGRFKQRASHAVRAALPGRVWAEGGKPIAVRDEAHHREVFRYILDHATEGDWVWSFRQETGEVSG